MACRGLARKAEPVNWDPERQWTRYFEGLTSEERKRRRVNDLCEARRYPLAVCERAVDLLR
jgi:hypothetical protein